MKVSLHIVPALVYCLVLCSHINAFPAAKVKSRQGLPALFIDDELIPPFAYMSYLGEEKYYKEAANAGIHLYCFPAYLGDRGINSTSGIGPFRKALWVEESTFDFSSIKNDFDKILRADPNARVIIRFHLDVPQWWDERYPEECQLLPDGSIMRQSFHSKKWRKQAGDVLRECIQWLQDSPYAGHLVGIHVAGGFTEEWFYHFKDHFYDKNPLRTTAFRNWLKNRYSNNQAYLQRAWKNHSVSFEAAKPADISGSIKEQRWRDPNKERHIIDTFRFHAATMADNIAWFCNIIKEASDGDLLTGAFYGYHYFVTDPRRGHGALAQLLECPDLDYLSSPNVYNRVMGEDWPPMAAVQSVQLHGKLWLAENDTRTSLTTLLKERAPEICPPGQYESSVWLGPPDVESSTALLWKNSARMLTSGYGGWWFDMWGGWFSHIDYLKVLQHTQELYTKYPYAENNTMPAQVCVFVDEELSFYDTSFGSLTSKILNNRSTLAKTGAPYDLFLRSDIDTAPLDSYRVIWLMGVLELSESEHSLIDAWRKSGKTVLWTNGDSTKIFTPERETTLDQLAFNAEELQGMWKNAGVFIYLDTNDVFYAGRSWLSIHSIAGGKKTIRLPFAANIYDPVRHHLLSESEREVVIDMPGNSTVLLRVEK